MDTDSDGWKTLLIALGFRFEKAHNDIPDSVFFPSHEYLNILNNGSNTLYAFLGKCYNVPILHGTKDPITFALCVCRVF